MENRCRLHCEIVREIKRRGGVDFPVIVKLGIEDTLAGGTVEAEGIRAATLLAAQGNVDIIEVSQGLQNMDDMERTCLRPHILSTDREAYFRTWAGKVRAAVRGGALVTFRGDCARPRSWKRFFNAARRILSLCAALTSGNRGSSTAGRRARPLQGEMHLLQQVPLGAPHARETPRLCLFGYAFGSGPGVGLKGARKGARAWRGHDSEGWRRGR